MPKLIQLIGLDFGTTTCRAIIASAELTQNCVTGRTDLSAVSIRFKLDPIFTPFRDDHQIDIDLLETYIDRWCSHIRKSHESESACAIFGGAIVTGIAAEQSNALAITRLIRTRFNDALIATANDPGLESWLAFMGGCSQLSLAHPEKPILNLDIGGGTTNLALGMAGQVLNVGSCWVGARHFQFRPGSYCLTQVSQYGQKVLTAIRLRKKPGDVLTPSDVHKIINFFITSLETMVWGKKRSILEQMPFRPSKTILATASITFSGGVGELIYQHTLSSRSSVEAKTPYGDLGVELAHGILSSRRLSASADSHVPENRGRATVFGIALHNIEISGSTLFIKNPSILPIADLPVIGAISSESQYAEVKDLLKRAFRTQKSAGIYVNCDEKLASIELLTKNISQALIALKFPQHLPLIFFVPKNCGKTIGNLITRWGRLKQTVMVIDEVRYRHAQFVSIGKLQNGYVAVSFYGSLGG